MDEHYRWLVALMTSRGGGQGGREENKYIYRLEIARATMIAERLAGVLAYRCLCK